MKRNYGQMCGLASAVTVIGERWTALIIRELLLGPMRFHHLQENLPGIGPNLLTLRLNSLREAGVIEQIPVEQDARGRAYRLTEVGEELRRPVLQMAKWGLQFLTSDDHGEVRSEWAYIALQALVCDADVPDVTETYHFSIDDTEVTIDVDRGNISFRRGQTADGATVTVISDAETFVRIGARLQSPLSAIATGKVQVVGDMAAIERCIDLLGLSG